MSLSKRKFLCLEDSVKVVQMLESGRSSQIIATEFNIGPFNFLKFLHVLLTMLSCKLFRWTQYNTWNLWALWFLNLIEKEWKEKRNEMENKSFK